MTVFFGDHWGAPILEYASSAPTPVGVACYLCDRPIHRGDQGFIRPLITESGPGGNLPVHRGCDMAVTILVISSASAAALAGMTSTNAAKSWSGGTTRGC